MARFKPYDYNQKVMVPVCLEDQLLPNTLEYAIHAIVEHRIDMSIFDEKYKNDETGCRAYDPKLLLKVVLFGYSRGLLSSRQLETACRENITFMSLSCGYGPDHSTIAAFISSMHQEILPIFRTILLICDAEGLLGGTCFAVDGLKLPSNASKEMSGTFAGLNKKKERLEKQLQELIRTHQSNDQSDQKVATLKQLQTEKAEKLEKSIAKIKHFLEENEPKPGRKRKENKSNITDNDSHLMTTSHGVIQGYNAQAVVDAKHQVIIHADAGNSGQDDRHLALMVTGVQENLQAIGKEERLNGASWVADPNYFSPSNLKSCMSEQVDAYIPDKDFRKRDPRLKDSESPFTMADFRYDSHQDHYTCPAGKRLSRQSDSKRDGQPYYRSYAAQESDCGPCPFRKRCLAKKLSKRRYLSVQYDQEVALYAQRMAAKLETDAGRRRYDERIAIVEPVFANIRIHKRMDRFSLRGKTKVNIQWLLYSIVHNVEKLLHYGSENAFCPA